jgi:hypothetical protein
MIFNKKVFILNDNRRQIGGSYFHESAFLFKNCNFQISFLLTLAPAIKPTHRQSVRQNLFQCEFFSQKPRGRGGVILSRGGVCLGCGIAAAGVAAGWRSYGHKKTGAGPVCIDGPGG